MIQNKILTDLKSEFDLIKLRERFLYYFVARKLGFKYVDIANSLNKQFSNVYHLLKHHEVEDDEQQRVSELIDKYKFENYLK